MDPTFDLRCDRTRSIGEFTVMRVVTNPTLMISPFFDCDSFAKNLIENL